MAHNMDTKFGSVSFTPKTIKALKPSWTDEQCIKKAEEISWDVMDYLEQQQVDFIQEEI